MFISFLKEGMYTSIRMAKAKLETIDFVVHEFPKNPEPEAKAKIRSAIPGKPT